MTRGGIKKHWDLILEWKAGADIQFHCNGNWVGSTSPSWDSGIKYRKKPAGPMVVYVNIHTTDIGNTAWPTMDSAMLWSEGKTYIRTAKFIEVIENEDK